MKSAMRGADQTNALERIESRGLSRLGISSHGIIVCFVHLASAGYRAGQFVRVVFRLKRPLCYLPPQDPGMSRPWSEAPR